ncbi:hypothetical protein GCM10010269_31310 [Streptomyces humidus]|uniref:SDR family NAD(P)-dependent oxidoreductase n=1 Tax=Streptomyces humidus TaxID=52259 RepID=A0A918FWM0_9ACTN|nr:hypothetical protein GCM10010269_31310 [Streptomyces humidus]
MSQAIIMSGAKRGLGRAAVERILTGSPQTHLMLLTRDTAGAELATDLSRTRHSVTSIPTDLLSLGSTVGRHGARCEDNFSMSSVLT